MLSQKTLPLLALAALLFTACDDDTIIDDILPPDEVIVRNQTGLYPEGIDYDDDKDRFLISSVTTGNIGGVDDNGNYTVLVDNDEIFSAVGILVDNERNRVLVAIGDFGAAANSTPATINKTAKLGSFSLDDGSMNWIADLAALNDPGDSLSFANDVAIDDDGNAYVTNSFAPYLYRVNPDGGASVFVRDDRFRPGAGAFGFNGIVQVDDYLIVAYSETNSLYRFRLDGSTDGQEIELSQPLPDSPDGLELQGRDNLVVVANASREVIKLDREDDWQRLTFVESQPATLGEFPTTAVVRAGQTYVLYAYLNKLMMGDATQSRYEIERVDF